MDLEAKISHLGSSLLEIAKKEEPGLFNRDYWQGRLLDWVMRDPSFKVDMFRFVDVLPQLSSSDAISEHVKQYLLKDDRELPTLINAALKAATSKLTSKLATKAIKDNVMEMAGRFILGQSAQEAIPALKKLHQDNIAFTVDLLGEATLGEQEAEVYQKRYLNLIDELSTATKEWPESVIIDRNHLGPIPRTNVSMKISAMYSQLRPTDPKSTVAELKKRLLPILLRAKERNVFVNFDLEQWDYHDITYDLFEEVVQDPKLKDWPNLGIVVQAYLKTAARDVERLHSIAKARNCPLTVRLVKGAYWDYEVVRAKQKGHESPVIIGKSACDANYEKLSIALLSHVDTLNSAFGSHNLRSLAHAIAYANEKGLPKNAYEVQMLYGMAEPERKALKMQGHRVRLYAPIGDLLVGMAYLVRRLLENTSNSGFLQMTHHAKVDVAKLMKKPSAEPERIEDQKAGEASFKNCSFLDFLKPEVRVDFQKNIDKIRASLPLQVPVVINGAQKSADDKHVHFCPSESSQPVYSVDCASIQDADLAVDVAHKAFLSYRETSIDKRAQLLCNLADILEKDRIWLAALQTIEVGKPWMEADADVAEAIDFCRYYAQRGKIELASQKQGKMLGEENELRYLGRGPTVVIAPWNFPLAIICGMATAALVAGNTIILKPAEQSSMTAYALYQRMISAGFSKDTVQFLPGRGELIGAHLVKHQKVAQIAFTGSKAVGLSIYHDAANTQKGQPEIKRVVCEMGGKNAIIVDDDADLDEAVLGVVNSAFGFAGQKCSACSRVIVVASVADTFISRLIEATRSLVAEKSFLPSCFLGPVIDEDAHSRLLAQIEQSSADDQLLYVGERVQGGYFVPPAIFEVKSHEHRLMQDEFFGPIVAIMRVPSFETALVVANSTPYALTGAVFSRSPLNLSAAQAGFRVGNLYLNRGSTGAMVGRQPFGGFQMSGLGSKAGGPGYLHHFAQPMCVTENTMRRGFTPELST